MSCAFIVLGLEEGIPSREVAGFASLLWDVECCWPDVNWVRSDGDFLFVREDVLINQLFTVFTAKINLILSTRKFHIGLQGALCLIKQIHVCCHLHYSTSMMPKLVSFHHSCFTIIQYHLCHVMRFSILICRPRNIFDTFYSCVFLLHSWVIFTDKEFRDCLISVCIKQLTVILIEIIAIHRLQCGKV